MISLGNIEKGEGILRHKYKMLEQIYTQYKDKIWGFLYFVCAMLKKISLTYHI